MQQGPFIFSVAVYTYVVNPELVVSFDLHSEPEDEMESRVVCQKRKGISTCLVVKKNVTTLSILSLCGDPLQHQPQIMVYTHDFFSWRSLLRT